MDEVRKRLGGLASPRLGRRLAAGVLVLVALRTLWLLAAAWPYDTDDAFITLRYARNWADGHGIVWNVGDIPVEGYSNFLSLVLARIAFAVGVDPLLVLKAVGALAFVVTGALVYRLARRYLGPAAATAPVVLLTAHPGQLLWAVAGLETSTYTLCVVAAVFAVTRALRVPVVDDGDALATPAAEPDLRWAAAAGGLACVASLVRPEGPLVAFAIGLPLAVGLLPAGRRRATARALLALGLCFALPYALYFAWRWSYFGRPLPNSVYCKSDYIGDRFKIVRAFWEATWWLPLVSLIIPWRRLRAPQLATLALTAAYVVILIGADPVLSFWDRYFLPVHALLVVTACVGIDNLARLAARGRVSVGLRQLVLALGALLATGSLVDSVYGPVLERTDRYALRTRARESLAAYLSDQLRPGEWYVIGDAGLVPYLTGGRVLDAFCLNNPAMTRPPIDRSAERFVDDMYAKKPMFIAVHSSKSGKLKPRKEGDKVFPEVIKRPEFLERYGLVAIFGDDDDRFFYWLFRRKDTLKK
jgi:hypothetical protein